MSFKGLLKNKVTITRRDNTDSNGYGESVGASLNIVTDLRCSRQVGPGNNMRQNIENKAPGTISYKLARYYTEYFNPRLIQEGDFFECDNGAKGIVREVHDAAGRNHHLEILVEELKPQGEADTANG